MSNRSGKTTKRRPWGDLPHDILGFIFGKSGDAVDVIRFRAVCKNWRNVDHIPKPGNLPWLCDLSWSNDRLKCSIHDPYSGQKFVTWKHIKSRFRYTRSHSNSITCFGSNEGWLIAGYPSLDFIKWALFMYNPYTKDFISLSRVQCYHHLFATFSGNRVFVFSCKQVFPHTPGGGYANYIASCILNGEGAKKEWVVVCVGSTQGLCRGLQFVKEQEKEQLLCLFSDGIMRSYSLSSSSSSQLGYLTLVSLGEGSHRLAEGDQRLWLAKGDGDLLVACELDECDGDQWSTFYFDWSSMSWMASDLRVICAHFNAVDLSTYVGRRPFAGYDRKVHYKK